MSIVRTVLGDIASKRLGICYSHEHVVIRGEFFETHFPEFMLDDLDAISRELLDLREVGVGAMIDAMPIDAGRSVRDLAEISARTGMHIVAATGLHLRLYYPTDHWYDTIDEDRLVDRMTHEIEVRTEDNGIPTPSRAGVIKVAGSLNRLTELEQRNFRAAGRAQHLTGCPILTHTEQGTAALEQIRILQSAGADLSSVVLSHLDRCDDVGYHREVLSTGVKLEYDSAFRWKGERNHTFELLMQLAPEFPHSFVLGMDAAKSAYWMSFGGKPGLTYLFVKFAPKLLDKGLPNDLVKKIFVDNPAKAYSFKR